MDLAAALLMWLVGMPLTVAGVLGWVRFQEARKAPVTDADPIAEQARDMKISHAALWEANRHGTPAMLPEEIFAAAKPAPGVLPDGVMAMDYAPVSLDRVAAYALQQQFHEGIGFLGYPYLAELAQRAEYRNIASIWAEHCTRKWIDLKGEEGKIKELSAELERLNVRQLFREAIEKECFFGRIQLFLDFGDWNKPRELATPLLVDPRKIKPSRPLRRIAIVEPMWSYPGSYSADNPLAPDFYNPQIWYVNGRTVHASRLLTMVGHHVPNMLKPAYAFGGMALSQLCKPYVDNWLRTRQSVSDLVHSFSVMVLKTDMAQRLQSDMSGGDLFRRVDLFNKTRDNRGTFVLDKNEEDFENVSVPIAGLHELQAQSQEQMSSVSKIPLTILLGITPAGLNASSDGEFRAFYDTIIAYNERVVANPLKAVIEAAQLSIWGKIDEELTYQFMSLWEMSAKEQAEVRKIEAETDKVLIDAGVIGPEESRERLNNDETGPYHGSLSGPPPENDDEDEEPAVAAE